MKIFSVILFWGFHCILEGKKNIVPHTEFLWDLEAHKGVCEKIPSLKVETDTTKYKGRWYGVYVGFKKSQADRVSCIVWDSLFDEDGTRYDFYSLEENNKLEKLTVKNSPDHSIKGLYEFDAGHDKKTFPILSTDYYVDDQMLVRIEVVCQPKENKFYHDLVVAFRDLKDVASKKDQLNEIVKKLNEAGAKSEFNEIKHENCKYPPLKKDLDE